MIYDHPAIKNGDVPWLITRQKIEHLSSTLRSENPHSKPQVGLESINKNQAGKKAFPLENVSLKIR